MRLICPPWRLRVRLFFALAVPGERQRAARRSLCTGVSTTTKLRAISCQATCYDKTAYVLPIEVAYNDKAVVGPLAIVYAVKQFSEHELAHVGGSFFAAWLISLRSSNTIEPDGLFSNDDCISITHMCDGSRHGVRKKS